MEDASDNLPLENKWCFWFDRGVKKQGGGGKDQYLDRLKNLGEFQTVVDFWKHFNHLKVDEMKRGSNLMLFKAGVEPVWEHPSNVKGGKWVLPVQGSDLGWVWETCVLHAIGEQFCLSDSICGVVLARRGEPRGDSLCLWNNDCQRGAEDMERMREQLRATLRLPLDAQIVYQPHKGHIDFNQQHPPLPPKRRSSRRSSGEKSPGHSNRSSGAAAPASAPSTPSSTAAASTSAAAPIAAAAPVSYAAAAARSSRRVEVRATMDVEHTQRVLELRPQQHQEHHQQQQHQQQQHQQHQQHQQQHHQEQQQQTEDGSARRGAAAAPSAVLVSRRARSPAPDEAALLARAAESVPATAATKKGRARQKQEGAKALLEQQRLEKEREKEREKEQRMRKDKSKEKAQLQQRLDPAFVAVAALGVVVGLLSMWLIFRS